MRSGTVVILYAISARVFAAPAGSDIPAAERQGSNSMLPRLFFVYFFQCADFSNRPSSFPYNGYLINTERASSICRVLHPPF
ncbi:hypothetical protein ACQKWADRAFT_293100 [Trichoderma austrokoningii]